MSGSPGGSRWQDEAGLLATPVLFVVWSGLLVAIAVIDVGAYLVAAGRAQAAADAAALAAVSLDVEPATTPPVLAARTVAQRNRGELESCTCRLGSGRAEVRVSVAVYGLFIPRVTGAQRVTATARAELVASEPTGGPAPGLGPAATSSRTARARPSAHRRRDSGGAGDGLSSGTPRRSAPVVDLDPASRRRVWPGASGGGQAADTEAATWHGAATRERWRSRAGTWPHSARPRSEPPPSPPSSWTPAHPRRRGPARRRQPPRGLRHRHTRRGAHRRRGPPVGSTRGDR